MIFPHEACPNVQIDGEIFGWKKWAETCIPMNRKIQSPSPIKSHGNGIKTMTSNISKPPKPSWKT
jgi:hypothetical protein